MRGVGFAVALAVSACDGGGRATPDATGADADADADRPPAVTFVSPADGSTDVSPGTTVLVVFDEPIDADTVELQLAADDVIAASIAFSTNAVILTPDAPLAPGAYTAELGAGVADRAGHATAEGLTWSFTVPDTADHDPPEIVMVEPADGATGVSPDARVRVFFDEVIAPASAAGSLSVTGPSGALTGTIQPLGSVVALTPAAALSAGSSFTAQIAATVTDLAGNTSGVEPTWSFTTASGASSWSAPVQIDGSPAGGGGLPVAVANASGGVDVTFFDLSASYDIWHTRFSPTDGWGSPTMVETMEPGSCYQPDLDVSGDGSIAITWTYRDDAVPVTSGAVRWYDPDVGWSATTTLSSTLMFGFALPRIAVNASGLAAVVWQPDSSTSQLRVRRFDPSTGWAAEQTIGVTTVGRWVEDPELVMTDDGHIVLVWNELDGGLRHTAGAVYTPGAGWSASRSLGTSSASETEPELAEHDGLAMVVWAEHNAQWNIWTTTWTAADGWSVAEAIDQTTDGTDSPSLAVGPAGAIVAWTESATPIIRVVARTWTASEGWGASTVLDSWILDGGWPYTVVAAGNYKEVVAWRRRADSVYTVWSAQHLSLEGWRAKEAVGTGYTQLPSLTAVVDEANVPMAVWAATFGGSSEAAIFAARGIP